MNRRTRFLTFRKGTYKSQSVVAIACLFLSGFSGLVYEVCWIRKASLIFGSTTFAVSTILAVFFLGLAVGSYVFGKAGQRTSRPLRLYALIEVGLGVLALASLYAFGVAEHLYGWVYRELAGRGGILFLARVLLVSLVILPPSILMGGTLPLFCRQYVVARNRIANSVGLLYGLNTLGAAAGCAITGLVLLPVIGLLRSVILGAVVNILCGLVVGSLRITREALGAPDRQSGGESRPGGHIAMFALFFAVGFAALGNEVLWTRFLGLLIRNTVYTYTLTLTVVLMGIVFGSTLASRFSDRSASRALIFGTLQMLTGLSVLVLMTLPPGLWRGIGEELWIYVVALLPPAILSGASFPLAVRMVVANPSRASLGVGSMAAVNTLGGILGSLCVGFIGLPFFGLEKSLLFITGVSLLTGFVAWIRLGGKVALPVRGLAVLLAAAVWIGVPRVAGTHIPAGFLGERGVVVDFREGFGSNLAVIQNGDVLQLEIDRWWQGENRKNHQASAAHIPVLLHPAPRSVLVVGIGTGQTPGRFLMHDITRLDCVDIEPTIFEFIRKHFDSDWMDDARVTLIPEDGRNYIHHGEAAYDIISLEVGQIFRPGVAFFYTTDFYQRSRKRLKPGGFVVQFVPLPFFSPEQLRGVVRSFTHVFPQSVLWYNTSELLLIGVNAERFEINPNLLDRLAIEGRARKDLEYAYWAGREYWLNHPEVFLAGFLTGPDGLAALSEGGLVYRDDLPVLDYATSHVEENRTDDIRNAALVRRHLEAVDSVIPADLSTGMISKIKKIRDKNLGDVAVSAMIRRVNALSWRGDYGQVVALLSEAVTWNPDHAVAARMLGDAFVLQRRFDDARPHYSIAVRLRPEDARARHGLARVLHALGQLDTAIEHYRAALHTQPGNAEIHNNLGAALAQDGRFEEAMRHLEDALRLRPGFADAQRNLARIRETLRTPPLR